jgi:hypothetical protein
LPINCPYLSAIGSLLYLANTTQRDISFSINFLARFSKQPTKRHKLEIKHILKYLQGTVDKGLFYNCNNKSTACIIGYADVGYVSDTNARQFKLND